MTIHPYNTPGRTWRIATITFTAPPGLPGLRQSTINTIRTSDTSGPWVGWSFEVDGPSLLMISPTGWQAGKAERVGDKVTVYEVSKALAAIAWEYEPAVNHHDSLGQPLRWRDGAGEAGELMTGIAEYIPAAPVGSFGEKLHQRVEIDPKTALLEMPSIDEMQRRNEAVIAAAVAAETAKAFASPLPAAAPVERDEPPDEPIVPVKRGPGRPRKHLT